MSIYSYIGCKDCHEMLWVADPDSTSFHFHADPQQLLRFLEKHRNHILWYDWEDGGIDEYSPFEENT